MVEYIKEDIFKVKCDALLHQCNCFHTMGSGIARFIRETFPEAFWADLKTAKGDPKKMGTFSIARVKNPIYSDRIKYIINLYSQFDFNATDRNTRYDALVDGLTSIRDRIKAKKRTEVCTLAIPFRIGCNRGGGDWRIVDAIIRSIFEDEKDFNILICENPALQETLQNAKSK